LLAHCNIHNQLLIILEIEPGNNQYYPALQLPRY
jgi:hypothetical protein